MKKIFLVVLIAVSIKNNTAAQSVGIGTPNPNNSAIVDISSANKGVLMPRIYLGSTVDNSTIPSPASSLLVFNTNPNMPGGTGLFFNAGGPATANWNKVGDLVLPIYKATSTNSSAFRIDNYSQLATSSALKVYSAGGNALEVSGKLKIDGTGQSPALGKVLTSDASGNATWEGAVAFSAKGVKLGSQAVPEVTAKKIPFSSIKYDLAVNFTSADASPYSTFTVPVKGIYHFDVQVGWLNTSGGWLIVDLILTRNNNVSTVATTSTRNPADFMVQAISTDVLLLPGDQVHVRVNQLVSSSLDMDRDEGKTFFNGRLVTRL